MVAERKPLSGRGAMFDNQNYQKTADLHADSGLLKTVFMSTNVFYHISANAIDIHTFNDKMLDHSLSSTK